MKKLALLSLCVPILLLCSFTLRQDRGVKRISTHLYSLNTTANKRVSEADKAEIKRVIVDHYGIKDFGRDKIIIAADDPRSKIAGGLLDNSIYKDWVSTKFIFWKDIKTLPEEVVKANAILTKYAAK